MLDVPPELLPNFKRSSRTPLKFPTFLPCSSQILLSSSQVLLSSSRILHVPPELLPNFAKLLLYETRHHHRVQPHWNHTCTNFQLNLTTLIFVTLMTSPLSTDTLSTFSDWMDITIVSGVIKNVPVHIFSLIRQYWLLFPWWRHYCQLSPVTADPNPSPNPSSNPLWSN